MERVKAIYINNSKDKVTIPATFGISLDRKPA